MATIPHDAIHKVVDRIIMAFQEAIPRSTKRMDDHESNDRGNENTGIAKGEEKIGGRSQEGAEQRECPHAWC